MILINENEYNHLKEIKENTITMVDAEVLLEHKDIFLKFVNTEIKNYQYALGNWSFSWKRVEAEHVIGWLLKLRERLHKIDEVLKEYHKQQEVEKKNKSGI